MLMTPRMLSVVAAFAAWGLPERGDAVRDGLDAGQRRRSRREGVEDHEQGDGSGGGRELVRRRDRLGHRAATSASHESDDDHHEGRCHEGVRRDREQRAGFLDPAEVGEREEHDEAERDRDSVVCDLRDRRRDREHPGAHGNRDRQDVVDEERRRRGQARQDPEVLLADDVGAAARRIGADGLAVGRDHDREEQRDRQRDRDHEMDRRRARGEQDEQDLLGRVRVRRERVRREDRERDGLREQRVLEVVSSASRGRPARASPRRATDFGREPIQTSHLERRNAGGRDPSGIASRVGRPRQERVKIGVRRPRWRSDATRDRLRGASLSPCNGTEPRTVRRGRYHRPARSRDFPRNAGSPAPSSAPARSRALTVALLAVHAHLGLPSIFLLYLTVIVAIALIGGTWPALASSIAASALINWFFTPPTHTWRIAEPENVLALVVLPPGRRGGELPRGSRCTGSGRCRTTARGDRVTREGERPPDGDPRGRLSRSPHPTRRHQGVGEQSPRAGRDLVADRHSRIPRGDRRGDRPPHGPRRQPPRHESHPDRFARADPPLGWPR